MAQKKRRSRPAVKPTQRIISNEVVASTPELPDTTLWQPRADRSETLQCEFLKRCIGLEKQINLRVQLERESNINNFDSGSGVEDLLRSELQQLIPNRYSIRAGVVNDRQGRTAGDCDIIVFNALWFPAVKAGITTEARKVHFPIEGVYAVCEVKQSIDFDVLDQAMEKLVICHRLERPNTNANRLVENHDLDGCFHGMRNPLYSAIIATSVKGGTDVDRLVDRFFDINKSLKRQEVVRSLCILGHGTVTWHYRSDDQTIKPALFMREDLFKPIFPAYHKVPPAASALYAFVTDLMLHLYQSVLAAEDIAAAYGPREFHALHPDSPDIVLEPDREWMEKLNWVRDKHGNIVPIKRVRNSGTVASRNCPM